MSLVLAEHRPDDATLNVSCRRLRNGPGCVTAPGRFAFWPIFPKEPLMKIVITLPRRRNRLVAAAMFRRAGVHRRTGPSRRQDMALAIRRELNEMKHIP
jgi:hypothetical protein